MLLSAYQAVPLLPCMIAIFSLDTAGSWRCHWHHIAVRCHCHYIIVKIVENIDVTCQCQYSIVEMNGLAPAL